MFFRNPQRHPQPAPQPIPPATPLEVDRGAVAPAPEPPACAVLEPRPPAIEANAGFTWRKRIHERLLDTIDLRRRDLNRMSDDELRSETTALVCEIIAAEASLPPGLDRERLCREVLDEAIGLGPLETLLADEAVSEIMVNRFDQIFVERGGRIAPHPTTFTSDRAEQRPVRRG